MIDPQHEPVSDAVPAPAQSPILPAEQVFLEIGDSVSAAVDVSQAPVPLRKRGPGFWESIAWMLGIYVVQFGIILLAGIVLVAAFLMTGAGGNSGGSDVGAMIRSVTPDLGSTLTAILGIAQVATVAYALLAIRLRLGASGLRDLGFQRLWGGHWLLIALLMLPLLLLCNALQSAMFQLFPSSHDQMEEMMGMLAQAPLSVLVLMIGVGPAVAEEVLFRGLIGRGLLARYGLAAGIIMTSVLFGVVHINPAQGTAAAALGLAMHFAYYTTRSFWAPVAVHFFNNTLSVILLKNSSLPAVEKLSQLLEPQAGLPAYVLVASVAMVTAIVILLWQTRVQFVLSDGSIWNPGYTTASAPPPELGAIAVRQEPRLLMLAGSTINSLGFAAGVWRLTGWAGLPW